MGGSTVFIHSFLIILASFFVCVFEFTRLVQCHAASFKLVVNVLPFPVLNFSDECKRKLIFFE